MQQHQHQHELTFDALTGSASVLYPASHQLFRMAALSQGSSEQQRSTAGLLRPHVKHLVCSALLHIVSCSWLDEAQLWLAVRAESNTEAEKMKQAMEVSLAELAAAKAAAETAPPLTNLSEERLRHKFGGSALLQRLEGAVPGSVLFSDASPLRELVKFRLVELLRLEDNCCRWYPCNGTRQYWDAFGSEWHAGQTARVAAGRLGCLVGCCVA
jgi:hypothetical protein